MGICLSVLGIIAASDDVVVHPEAQPDGSSPEWRPVDYDVDGLLQLTSANFSSARAAHSLLVAFHAPWCSHCRAFLPIFASAADHLLERGRPVRLATVDAIAEEALADEFEIEGYPTILWLGAADGRRREFAARGNARAEQIVSWVEKRLRSPLDPVHTSADAHTWATAVIKRAAAAEEMAVSVLALLPRGDAALRSSYERVAGELSDWTHFALTDDSDAYSAALQRGRMCAPKRGS